MRVHGSKKWIRLTEAELEPGEAKPMRRVAPIAAAIVWLGSIVIATAIYLDWLPARALLRYPQADAERARFSSTPAPPKPTGDTGQLAQASPRARGSETWAPQVEQLLDKVEAEGVPRTSSTVPPTVARPKQPLLESKRVIRGSYHSDNTHWAAGW
jgi:hypothetical protein